MDDERRVVYEGGAVAVRNGRIVAVGAHEDVDAVLARDDYRGAEIETIDATNMLVLPGLIDSHCHAGHALVKTLGCGDSRRRVSDWARACHELYTVGSTEAFWEAEAELCALERLKFGITTGVSVLGGGDMVFRTDDARYGIAHCRGVARVGTKSVVAVGANRPSAMVPVDADTARTEWVYAHVEEEDGKEGVTFTKVDVESQLRVCEELIRRCHDAQEFKRRVRLALCPPVHDPRGALPETVSLEEIVDAAARHRALADKYEGVTFTQDGHSGGTIAWAGAHGLLDGSASYLSHSTDLVDADFEALKKSGASIVHNPSAVASILGRCPVRDGCLSIRCGDVDICTFECLGWIDD